MVNLIKTVHTKADIIKKREEISRFFKQESSNVNDGNISALSVGDLKLMYQLYDKVWFHNWFRDDFKGSLHFSLSRRMLKSAGLTLCPKNINQTKMEDIVIEIRIGVEFFFHYGLLDGNKKVCGIMTHNGLEALQLVFEHEMCHAIEFILFGNSSCKKDRFKTIAANLFGHTESHHVLPTHRQIASQRLGLNIGDTVLFTFEGKRLEGFISNITKRATVMVSDVKGLYVDKKGNRYSKYYVPLQLLTRK